MIVLADAFIKKRKIIPLWRSLTDTPSKELQSEKNLRPIVTQQEDEIRRLYLLWQREPTLENATEVVDFAAVRGFHNLVTGPAKQLLAEGSNATAAVRKVAGAALRPLKESPDEEISLINEGKFRSAQISKIRALKEQSERYPYNALLWLEIARTQIILNQSTAAERSMRRALAIAPNNRHVLRAAARLFVHDHDLERAIHVLRKSDAIKADPWVQAAEIATSSLAGRTPSSMKSGRRLVEEASMSPFHLSELASAVGTEEAISGSIRRGRKFLRQSLVAPSDNSAAQGFWAQESRIIDVDMKVIASVRSAHEAKLRLSLFEEDYVSAVEHSIRWMFDEEYSAGPPVDGSFFAATFLDEHDLAIKIIDHGLITNPGNPLLLNNKTVSLVQLGKLRDAEATFSEWRVHEPENATNIGSLATSGLLSFRAGDIPEGRALYEAYIQGAAKEKDYESVFRALVHWVYEEAYSGATLPDDIEAIMASLEQVLDKLKLTSQSRALWRRKKEQISQLLSQRQFPNVTRAITSGRVLMHRFYKALFEDE